VKALKIAVVVFQVFHGLSSLPGLKTALLVDTAGNCAAKKMPSNVKLVDVAAITDGTYSLIQLSQEAVDAPSVNSFNNQLAKRRLRQMDFFMD